MENAPLPPEEQQCPVHHKAFKPREWTNPEGKVLKLWSCPTQLEDGTWCKEKPVTAKKPRTFSKDTKSMERCCALKQTVELLKDNEKWNGITDAKLKMTKFDAYYHHFRGLLKEENDN